MSFPPFRQPGTPADPQPPDPLEDLEAEYAERMREKTNGTGDNGVDGGDIGEPPEQPEPPISTYTEPEIGSVKGHEDGLALAYAAQHEGRWLHDHTDAEWFRWTGTQWLADTRKRAFHEVREFVRAFRASLKKGGPLELTKRATIANVVALVAVDPRVAFSRDGWNTDPWLLGTPNGPVNLKTGELLEPRPEHYINRATLVVPAEQDTPHPLWSAFLDQATGGDIEVQVFLQRLAGYCLTGDVSEEMLAFIYGAGGTGKSTFVSTIQRILGDYAITMDPNAFSADSRLNPEYYRAQMDGPRLVIATETGQDTRWAEQFIKDLTGNDGAVSARNPYGRPFNFRLQAKLLVVGNHAPSLKSRSTAMERRLRVVPFTHAPEVPDPDLKDKLVAEYPAILRWMIDGCRDWQINRLGKPAAVAAASNQYFEAQDTFRRWMDERCTLDRQLVAPVGRLLANYNGWAKDNGEDTLSGKAFAELVRRTPGLRPQHTRNGNVVRGIGLGVVREEMPPDPQADLEV